MVEAQMNQEVKHGDMVFDGEGLPPLPEEVDVSLPEAGVIPMPAMPSQTVPTASPQIPAVPTDGIPKFEVVAVRLANGDYENREYVTILIPGDPKASPRHKVTDALREKYRPWYVMWRKGLQQTVAGTPLEMWPLLTPVEIEMMKALNIFTVEQLLLMADANDHRLPMAKTLKIKAREWLESKKDADLIENNRAERDELKTAMGRLEEQNLALAEQVKGLISRIPVDDDDKPNIPDQTDAAVAPANGGSGSAPSQG